MGVILFWVHADAGYVVSMVVLKQIALTLAMKAMYAKATANGS